MEETLDLAVPVSRKELEEERARRSESCRAEALLPSSNKLRKKVPKPGHYPLGFSPYSLDVRSSLIVPLSGLNARQDLMLIRDGFREEFKSTYFEERMDAVGPISPTAQPENLEIRANQAGNPCKRRRVACTTMAPLTKAEEARQLRAAMRASVEENMISRTSDIVAADTNKGYQYRSEPQRSSRTCRLLHASQGRERLGLLQPA